MRACFPQLSCASSGPPCLRNGARIGARRRMPLLAPVAAAPGSLCPPQAQMVVGWHVPAGESGRVMILRARWRLRRRSCSGCMIMAGGKSRPKTFLTSGGSRMDPTQRNEELAAISREMFGEGMLLRVEPARLCLLKGQCPLFQARDLPAAAGQHRIGQAPVQRPLCYRHEDGHGWRCCPAITGSRASIEASIPLILVLVITETLTRAPPHRHPARITRVVGEDDQTSWPTFNANRDIADRALQRSRQRGDEGAGRGGAGEFLHAAGPGPHGHVHIHGWGKKEQLSEILDMPSDAAKKIVRRVCFPPGRSMRRSRPAARRREGRREDPR